MNKVGTLPALGFPLSTTEATKTPTPTKAATTETATTATATTKPNSALANHIAFFETQGTGIVTSKGTALGLRKLGLGGISVPFGGVALTAPFSIPQNKSLFANQVHMDRIQEGVRGGGTDTGVFNKADGSLNVDNLKKFWTSVAGPKGYINDADVSKLVNKKPAGQTPGLGPVAALEWNLLKELAGQITTTGERVLTLEHIVAFYDGSLFNDLAAAREAGTLYKPTGATSHDGLKKVAKGLSSQALQLGGVDAGEGAKANKAATFTIDEAASLEYQQKTKTLGSTLAGAFKALCPAGKG
jgi:hypothetical protein